MELIAPIDRNVIVFEVRGVGAGINVVLLTYIWDWCNVIGLVIHGESKFWATWAAQTMWVELYIYQQSPAFSQKLGRIL